MRTIEKQSRCPRSHHLRCALGLRSRIEMSARQNKSRARRHGLSAGGMALGDLRWRALRLGIELGAGERWRAACPPEPVQRPHFCLVQMGEGAGLGDLAALRQGEPSVPALARGGADDVNGVAEPSVLVPHLREDALPVGGVHAALRATAARVSSGSHGACSSGSFSPGLSLAIRVTSIARSRLIGVSPLIQR